MKTACRLSVLLVFIMLLMGKATLSRSGPPDSPREGATAVIAFVRGAVWVHRLEAEARVTAKLGDRLAVGDIVKTERDASASIYAGGQLLELGGGSQLRIAMDLAAGARNRADRSPISAASIKILERGVWVLSDPEGSVVVPPMRGHDENETMDRSRPLLLSPRRELVLDAQPQFFWVQSPAPVRVVIAQGQRVIWASSPVSGSTLDYPAEAPALMAGTTYDWWLESPQGTALTERSSFHVASQDTIHAADLFESEMRKLERSSAGRVSTQFLRSAYYLEIGSWNRVLEALRQMPDSPSTGFFTAHTTQFVGRQLGVGHHGLQELLDLRRERRSR